MTNKELSDLDDNTTQHKTLGCHSTVFITIPLERGFQILRIFSSYTSLTLLCRNRLLFWLYELKSKTSIHWDSYDYRSVVQKWVVLTTIWSFRLWIWRFLLWQPLELTMSWWKLIHVIGCQCWRPWQLFGWQPWSCLGDNTFEDFSTTLHFVWQFRRKHPMSCRFL